MLTETDRTILHGRILARVTVNPLTGCWNFPPTKGTKGYGVIVFGGRKHRQTFKVHRFMYEMLRGPIGSKHIHHECENRACCNPDHLTPMTPGEHTLIAHAGGNNVAATHKRKTHCVHGHPLSGANVKVKFHHGHEWLTRECIACRRQRARDWYQRNREKKKALNANWYWTRGKAMYAERKARTKQSSV